MIVSAVLLVPMAGPVSGRSSELLIALQELIEPRTYQVVVRVIGPISGNQYIDVQEQPQRS